MTDAMASTGFNNPYFTNERPPAQGGYQTPLAPQPAPTVGEQARIEGMYAAPAAGANETGRMTYEDTIAKTAALFAVMLVVGAVSWFFTLGGHFAPEQATGYNLIPAIVGAVGTLVISLVYAFRRTSMPGAGLAVAYAVAEGLFVGGISAFFEVLFPGIVFQAALASIAVIATTLALFANGKIRASAKMTKIVMIAMIGYAVFSLLNVGLMMFGVLPEGMAFGLRSMEIAGIPLGLILGVVVVL
ncbi:MAG TPA: Bax inhibitor-1/YccA family protein, partial [Candidatus Microbacterium stercoravium]|nr:Bax inhibitor-1/YccA family protein [Candidatus Microbacterium stercoravium]